MQSCAIRCNQVHSEAPRAQHTLAHHNVQLPRSLFMRCRGALEEAQLVRMLLLHGHLMREAIACHQMMREAITCHQLRV